MKQITMTADIKTMALTDKLRFAKERIAELEQELSDSQGIVQLLTMRQTEAAGSYDALKKANASLKEQLGLQTAAKQEAYREIRVMQGEIDRLKEQVRVREDFMRMMRDYMNRSSTNDFTLSVWGQFVKDYPYMLDVFDENGKGLDEKGGVEI